MLCTMLTCSHMICLRLHSRRVEQGKRYAVGQDTQSHRSSAGAPVRVPFPLRRVHDAMSLECHCMPCQRSHMRESHHCHKNPYAHS